MSKLLKRAIQYLKWLVHKIRLHRKLKEMDDWWYFMGGSCFGLFSPSFYYTQKKQSASQRKHWLNYMQFLKNLRQKILLRSWNREKLQ